MIWKTQYKAIMLVASIILLMLTLYTGDPYIFTIGFGIQILLHIFLLLIHYILIFFGKQLFYTIRIDKKGKIFS
jgi:hypothetical protein